jgi:prepilin-type processing-associated H-X9-DG protein
MVVEVPPEHAVHWMSPVDADEKLLLSVGPQSKLAHSGRDWGGVYVLFADGSVRFLSADVPAATRRALISVAGKDDPGGDW